MIASTASARAAGMHAHHNLKIELNPGSHKLTAVDEIAIQSPESRVLEFHLSERVSKPTVSLDKRPREFILESGRLKLGLEAHELSSDLTVTIRYGAVFDDPVPVRPLNADDPGYGVMASISEKGSFLLPGASWYPELMGGRATYRVSVSAPAGVVAVTAGRSLGHQTAGGQTVSIWQVDYPVEGLSLSAAPYVVSEKSVGTVTAATYLLPGNQHLAESYLEATAGYIALFSDLFGSYPFRKFAVVENFFPTGYGFPSYTVMGGSVLRLPFILHTSLGHEIAHCWWGNGVYVDYAEGNWSEALTTYVADYLFKEMKSKQAALEYRRQWLRNFATLVRPENDFPLDRFRSRYNPVSKVIGYDKGAMVFHMLRRELGEEAFWNALRDIYHDRLFLKTSWSDLQRAFEKRGQRSLKVFFQHWLHRKGAPQFRLDGIQLDKLTGKWRVNGQVVQKDPSAIFSVTLALAAEREKITKKIPVIGEKTPFEMIITERPQKLAADPAFETMRLLYAAEIPPTVNNIKGSAAVRIVLSNRLPAAFQKSAETLALSLGLKNYQVMPERDARRHQLVENDIVMVGLPAQKDLLPKMPDQVGLQPGSFSIGNVRYDGSSDAFFAVFQSPFNDDRTMALYLPSSKRHADSVARKITHYGKYSYLVFQRGQNKVKGTWPAGKSPLVFEFDR